MKRLIFFSLFLCGICSVQARQQAKPPTIDEVAKKNVEEMETRLKLNPTQKSVIYNYAYDLAKETLAIIKKQQSGAFKNEDDAIYYRLQNEFNVKVKTVLKPEQVAEFNKLIEDRLNGVESKKKKKKRKKPEEEETVVGIEGLKSAPPPGKM